MPARQVKPRCYYGDGKVARYPADKPRWCSQRCAAEWAAAMKEGGEDEWCPSCRSWIYPEQVHRCAVEDVTRRDRGRDAELKGGE